MRGRARAVRSLATLMALGLGVVILSWGPLRDQAVPIPADRAFPIILPSPGTPLRLTVFGTSLTAGSRWPEDVAQGLEACFARPIVLNRIAQPGATSLWAQDHVSDVLESAPDIVVMEFAINDADLRDGVSLADSIAAHQAIILALKAARPDLRIVLMTMSPAQGLRGIMRPRLAAYYAAYRALADMTDTGLVDLYPRWLTRPRATRGLADGLHPEDAVARTVIVPVLQAYLGRSAGMNCNTP